MKNGASSVGASIRFSIINRKIIRWSKNRLDNRTEKPDLRRSYFSRVVSLAILPTSCCNGKGDPSERGNYRARKSINQILKIVKRVIKKLIRQHVDLTKMYLRFMSGPGTVDAILILGQLWEKYLAKKGFAIRICIFRESCWPRSI